MTNNQPTPDLTQLDRMVIVPDANGDNPTMVVMAHKPAVAGAFRNRDGSVTFWSRGDDDTLPPLLSNDGPTQGAATFDSHADAVAYLVGHGLTARPLTARPASS